MTTDKSKISCTPTLTVPVTLEENIVGHKKFNPIAKINHSGNLAGGCYSSFIKSRASSLFQSDHATVIPSKEAALSNDTFYIFFVQIFFFRI